jgi:hypothetical protein
VASLESARGKQRELTVRSAKERSAPAQKSAVEVRVDGPDRHSGGN